MKNGWRGNFQSMMRFTNTLAFLPWEKAITNQEMLMLHLDALAGLERWNDVRSALAVPGLPLAEAFVEADAAARPAGTGGSVSDATVNSSNQAFQQNRGTEPGVGTDFDGDKVKKPDNPKH